MAPIVHGLEAEYAGKIDFYFLDADDPATQPFQEKFSFRVQPELHLLDADGKVIKSWVGAVREEDLRSAFESALK